MSFDHVLFIISYCFRSLYYSGFIRIMRPMLLPLACMRFVLFICCFLVILNQSSLNVCCLLINSMRGQTNIAKVLLEEGADVNAVNEYGLSALMEAR